MSSSLPLTLPFFILRIFLCHSLTLSLNRFDTPLDQTLFDRHISSLFCWVFSVFFYFGNIHKFSPSIHYFNSQGGFSETSLIIYIYMTNVWSIICPGASYKVRVVHMHPSASGTTVYLSEHDRGASPYWLTCMRYLALKSQKYYPDLVSADGF